jgi:hypothetical protein
VRFHSTTQNNIPRILSLLPHALIVDRIWERRHNGVVWSFSVYSLSAGREVD